MRKKVAEWRAACRKKIAEWRAAYRKKAAERRAALRKSILEKRAAFRKNIERLKACIDLGLSFISHFFVPILIVILTTIILFENRDLENEIGELSGKVGSLTEEMGDLSGRINILTGSASSLYIEQKELQAEIGTLSGEVNNLTESVNSLLSKQEELQTKLDGIACGIVKHNYESKKWQQCVIEELGKNDQNFPRCSYKIENGSCP